MIVSNFCLNCGALVAPKLVSTEQVGETTFKQTYKCDCGATTEVTLAVQKRIIRSKWGTVLSSKLQK